MYQFKIVTLYKIIQSNDSGGYTRCVAMFNNKLEAESWKDDNWDKFHWLNIEDWKFIELSGEAGEIYYELSCKDPQPIMISELGKEIK